MKNQTKHKNEKEMFAIVKSCLESGISRREFIKQNGISEAVFYFWYKKYRQSLVKLEDKFIPVVIPESKNQREQHNITVSKKTELEICYPNGVRVKLIQELDLSVLRSLISIL